MVKFGANWARNGVDGDPTVNLKMFGFHLTKSHQNSTTGSLNLCFYYITFIYASAIAYNYHKQFLSL